MSEEFFKVRCVGILDGDGYNLSYGRQSKKLTAILSGKGSKWATDNPVIQGKKKREVKDQWEAWAKEQYHGGKGATAQAAAIVPPPPAISKPPPIKHSTPDLDPGDGTVRVQIEGFPPCFKADDTLEHVAGSPDTIKWAVNSKGGKRVFFLYSVDRLRTLAKRFLDFTEGK